ncbi:acetyltransferase [Methanobrevibacter cuticularis]|uniref:Acetyltransferase n=1 Tax=Methanobrevibacter cuticularis TaxID=47311 RepID=A0A166CSJ0_9EURY|nr:GNAT family N-acetyltransferase [Methanobrevibacter cuticularis]KZX14816.1 acetyltransferase [Methanobrevibacter cuticularis]
MTFKFIYTDEKNEDFILLDNEQSAYYLNLLGNIAIEYRNLYPPKQEYFVVIVEDNDKSIACGAFKEYSKDIVEFNRIYVKEDYQRKGIGLGIVKELEKIAKKRGYYFAILETNIHMPQAIVFYDKLNYNLIENYEPFKNNNNCVCMKKKL